MEGKSRSKRIFCLQSSSKDEQNPTKRSEVMKLPAQTKKSSFLKVDELYYLQMAKQIRTVDETIKQQIVVQMLHKFPEFAKITSNLPKGWFKNKGRKFIRHEHKHLSAGIYKRISSECPNSCSHGCQKYNFDIMEVFSYNCLVCMPTDVLRIICNNEVAFGFPIGCV